MNLIRLLPIPQGVSFSKWAEAWLADVAKDVYSVEYNPDIVAQRNERFGSILTYLTTIESIYRSEGRRVRDEFHTSNPKPEKGIREWEERRDSITSKYRYMEDFLSNLREAIGKRISVSQSNLGKHKEELKANVAS